MRYMFQCRALDGSDKHIMFPSNKPIMDTKDMRINTVLLEDLLKHQYFDSTINTWFDQSHKIPYGTKLMLEQFDYERIKKSKKLFIDDKMSEKDDFHIIYNSFIEILNNLE